MIFFKLDQNERKQDDCNIDVYNVSNVTFMSVKYLWKQKKNGKLMKIKIVIIALIV